MAAERITPPGTPRMEICQACGQSFVVPIDLVDHVDEGLYLLALHCKNCDHLALGVHEDAELEAFEQRLANETGHLAAYAEVLEVSRFIDEADRFAQALDHDLLLPEDF
jgi:hypothetical protein